MMTDTQARERARTLVLHARDRSHGHYAHTYTDITSALAAALLAAQAEAVEAVIDQLEYTRDLPQAEIIVEDKARVDDTRRILTFVIEMIRALLHARTEK